MKGIFGELCEDILMWDTLKYGSFELLVSLMNFVFSFFQSRNRKFFPYVFISLDRY